ncbi:WYL domain-containing protein [Leyella stercorea]|uniref:WYL domain-containing protein n=1 Tax=Leyella stercorea TaxID=363265 RepID=UPI003F660AE3
MRNFAFESIILRIWKEQRNSFVNLLLARNVDYNYLRLYSLDRIEGVNLTDAHFVLPKDFCAKEYFAEYFGIV